MTISKRTFAGAIAALALSAAASMPVHASHGRGAAIVPSVDANGLLTLDMKGFWRRQGTLPVCTFPHDCIGQYGGGVSITGPNGFSTSQSDNSPNSTESLDLSDSRRAEVTQSNEVQLTGGAGLYTISWNSSAWQGGVDNVGSSGYGTRSTIFWDGQNANKPITFDLENIQQEVVRGSVYSDNLDAVAGAGVTLSYGATTSGLTGVNQAYTGLQGFSIDAAGNVGLTAAGTSSIQDNGSTGADVAFDGKISASDGSSVEFYWVFDGVAQGSNQTPDVADIVLTVVQGTNVNQAITATDPNGDAVSLLLTSFVGPGGITGLGESFVDNGNNSGTFSWDTTGAVLGQYIATVLGNDGGLSDSGSIRINVIKKPTNPGVPTVPLPASVLLLGAGLAGLGGTRALRRHKK